MAASDDTGAPTRLEMAIDAERSKLRKAHAVQKCLYEVLLYADGEDAVAYAEAAYVVATFMEESIDNLDPFLLRSLIEDAKRDSRSS
jgi:hypothetical protein